MATSLTFTIYHYRLYVGSFFGVAKKKLYKGTKSFVKDGDWHDKDENQSQSEGYDSYPSPLIAVGEGVQTSSLFFIMPTVLLVLTNSNKYAIIHTHSSNLRKRRFYKRNKSFVKAVIGMAKIKVKTEVKVKSTVKIRIRRH